MLIFIYIFIGLLFAVDLFRYTSPLHLSSCGLLGPLGPTDMAMFDQAHRHVHEVETHKMYKKK